MLLHYFALFIAILIGVGGQLAFKAGSSTHVDLAWLSFFQPYTVLGLACYFISAMFYIYSLKQIPVSIAFPCVSLSYAAVAFLAHLIWHEPFGSQHIIGLIFILLGVFLLMRA